MTSFTMTIHGESAMGNECICAHCAAKFPNEPMEAMRHEMNCQTGKENRQRNRERIDALLKIPGWTGYKL